MRSFEFQLEKREQKLISTAESLIEFLEGVVWFDLRRELEVALAGVRDDLEVCEKDESEFLKGAAKALRNVLEMPEQLKEIKLEERLERRERNGKKG